MSSAGVIAHCLTPAFPRPVLVTNSRHFTGEPTALVAATEDIGFASVISVVAISPNGRWAIGADSSDAEETRFQIMKFHSNTGTWSQLAPPVYVPSLGPNCFAWAPDSSKVAVGGGTENRLTVYIRTGDTFVAADPPDPIPGNSIYSLSWDKGGVRLACGIADTGFPLEVYDFVDGAFIGHRTTGVQSFGNPGFRVAFLPVVNTRYCALGGDSLVAVYDVSNDPITVAASVHDLDDADAAAGIHWDASGAYIFSVGSNNGPEYVRVWEFQGGVPTLETLEFVAAAPDQPANAPVNSDMRRGEYLAIAVTADEAPYIMDCTGPLPPTPNLVVGTPSSEGDVTSVSWSNV